MSVQRQMRQFGAYPVAAAQARTCSAGAQFLLSQPALDDLTYKLSRFVGIAAMGAGVLGTAALLVSI